MKNSCLLFRGLFILIFLAGMQLFAQSYRITFGMKGETGTPDSVYVQNQQKGTDIMLMGGDVLQLNIVSGLEEIKNDDTGLAVFPNPVNERAVVMFSNPQYGEVSVKLMDIAGRSLAYEKGCFPEGEVSFSITGIPAGTYILTVGTSMGISSTRLIASGADGLSPALHYREAQIPVVKNALNIMAESNSVKSMDYTNGETLTLRAYFQGATAEDTLIPQYDLEFEFGIFYYILNDYDLNYYKAVDIGDQVWMVDNLKVTHYPDGTSITSINTDESWLAMRDATKPEAYGYYGNEPDSSYGALYTWAAALKACPEGWHLPGLEEWEQLRDFVRSDGHFLKEGEALKADNGWSAGNGTDDYSFNGKPGGQHGYMDWSTGNVVYYGGSIGKGNNGKWWAAGNALVDAGFNFCLYSHTARVTLGHDHMWYGFSVRCVKN